MKSKKKKKEIVVNSNLNYNGKAGFVYLIQIPYLCGSKKIKRMSVRVRFAPSPTGALHIGGVRTALYNYLFAKKHGGDFLLRIEDTDQNRFVEGAEEYIRESLNWAGLKVDEGVGVGGEFGPYRQSERKHIYKKYADQLLDSGNAYIAFDTPQELDAKRRECESNKTPFIYNAVSRNDMKNSLTLSKEDTEKLLADNIPFVVRFKMPKQEELLLKDAIRGEIRINTNTLDDKVLFKSDGLPTYHLANVVDDHLMKITHVIRGEEWLPSMPLHILLYKAFGWEEEMPEFSHLSLILKPVGKGKLSKRDGDKMGFPVFPMEWKDPKTGEISTGYKEEGYLPEAFVNMLALLGWNPGTEQELFSMKELVESFQLKRVGKSGAKFDPEKVRWFNHQYIVKKTDAEIALLYVPILKEKGITIAQDKLEKICKGVKDRINFISELWEQTEFFFQAPTVYDKKAIKKQWKADTAQILSELVSEVLSSTEDYESKLLEEKVKKWIAQKELSMGRVMAPFRIAVVGGLKGPHLFDIVEQLGKEETVVRIFKAVERIGRD